MGDNFTGDVLKQAGMTAPEGVWHRTDTTGDLLREDYFKQPTRVAEKPSPSIVTGGVVRLYGADNSNHEFGISFPKLGGNASQEGFQKPMPYSKDNDPLKSFSLAVQYRWKF